jgi:hypothetical protein
MSSPAALAIVNGGHQDRQQPHPGAPTDPQLEQALKITESMAERFGQFTIVLGEVVVGVVEGLTV